MKITLTCCGQAKSWESESVLDEYGSPSISLCDDGIREFFDVRRKARPGDRLWLVIRKRPFPGSYPATLSGWGDEVSLWYESEWHCVPVEYMGFDIVPYDWRQLFYVGLEKEV